MFQKTLQSTIAATALWSGIWLALSAILEFWHRGFVVHYINTRWVWLFFGIAGIVYCIKLDRSLQ